MKQLILSILFLSCYNEIGSAQVSYIAHRGASYLAPENTIASINLAWKLGAAATECDVLLTKDNKIIVFHDKSTGRLLGKSHKVKDSTYDIIKSYNIKSSPQQKEDFGPQTIPLLKDVLKTIPDSGTLVIEIKCGVEIIPHLEKVLKVNWKQGKVAFISFNYQAIMKIKEKFPAIPSYFLAHTNNALNKRLPSILKSNLDGVDLNHRIINSKLILKLKASKKRIWCYTVNKPSRAIKLKELGVNGITKDRPKWLKEQSKK